MITLVPDEDFATERGTVAEKLMTHVEYEYVDSLVLRPCRTNVAGNAGVRAR